MIGMIEAWFLLLYLFTGGCLFLWTRLLFSHNWIVEAAIRVAARWYQNHLGGQGNVLLITNDKDNRRKAVEEGLSAETSMLTLLVAIVELFVWFLFF